MKKKKSKIYLIGALIIIFLIGSFFTFRIVRTNIFKKNANHINEKLVKIQDNFINDQKIFNKPLVLTTKITKDDIADEEIKLDVKLDLPNNISEFSINPSILNLTNPIEYYIHNSRKFVKSSDILSRMYEVSIDTSSVTCDATLECNTFTRSLKNINGAYPKDKIVDLLNETKELVNNSIGLFDIKKSVLKNNNYTKEYSYNINSKTLKKLKKNFNKDKNLKNNLYNLFKDYFDRYNINEENIDKLFDGNITGNINIYKSNNSTKYEIKLDNLFTLSLEESDNLDTYNIKLLGNFEFKINLDYANNKLKVNGFKGTEEVINLELDSKDILNLSGKININNKNYVLVSKDNINSSSDNTRSGTLKINLNNKNYTIEYSLEYVDSIKKSLEDNYANYTELTKEDMNNIETNLLKLTQSELLKDILAF